MISDYLHYSLDIKHLQRLVEYENYFLMELNKEALNYNPNTREIQVQRILDSMKHVEDRKAKLMRGVPKKEKKPKANIVIENLTQMDIDGTIVVAPPKDLFANAFSTETIEDNVIEKLAFKIDLEIKRIKQEMQTKVETASQAFKSTKRPEYANG
jgi:formate dehydrogenase maturation protein FdhE